MTDQLGTPRMIFDKTGSLANTKRHDYLPFGEELIAGQGLRTTTLGHVADNTRQKFTQKERDNETGLDYFGARYYAGPQGRFTTVDPLMASAHTIDPQTFNRYSYVGNNPLRYVDPNGMDKSAWELLTQQERDLIGSKLSHKMVGTGKNARKQTDQQAFNDLLNAQGLGGHQSVANVVAAFRNMLDITGARNGGAIWNGIKSIDLLFSGRDAKGNPNHHMSFMFTTNGSNDDFIKTLTSNGYTNNMKVAGISEQTWVRWAGGTPHKNSARYQTKEAFVVVPHFTQEESYESGHFDLHFDPASSNCPECSYSDRWDAAEMHNDPNMQLPALEERKFLQQQQLRTGLKVTTP